MIYSASQELIVNVIYWQIIVSKKKNEKKQREEINSQIGVSMKDALKS